MRILTCVLVVAFAVTACGPGVVDTTYPILGGYIFSDAGGSEKTILYRGDNAPHGIVVDARVDRYRIVGSRIIVARRPEIQNPGTNPITTRLSDVCEHWAIDTISHVTARIDDKASEAQIPCYSPSDEEFNPRL
jgi:hypothetical protein